MRSGMFKFAVISFIILISIAVISCQKGLLTQIKKVQAIENKSTWTKDVDDATDQFRKIYQKARELQKNNEYQKAYDLFSVLDKNYEVLYDFVLFNRSEVAKQIPDETAVINDLKKLIKDYPKSIIRDAALYSLGQAYVRIKDTENARKYFEGLVTKYPESNYSIGASYYLGEMNVDLSDGKTKAIKNFRSYLKEAPDGKFAVNSANALIKLVGENNLSNEDKELIGLAFYNGAEYSKAVKYLEQVYNERTWYSLGRSYQYSGNKTKAIEIYTSALGSFEGLDPEEVDNSIKATAAIKGNDYNAWTYCEKVFPRYADVALYFKAQKLYNDQAMPFYEKIVENYPESRYAPESNWSILWKQFNDKKYDSVIAQGKLHVKSYPDANSTSRVVFWVGKAYEKKGDMASAIKIYERMVNKFYGDYYAYRAAGRLNELKYNKTDYKWKTKPYDYNYTANWVPPLPISLNEVANNYGNNVAELLYLGDVESVENVLNNQIDPRMESYFNLKNGMKSKSIVVLRDNQSQSIKNPPGGDLSWELLYPLHFSTIIKQNANKNSIDPLLVQALTREESYFNHQAVSCSNAKGLMQLIPSTANAVANWEKLPSFSQLDLFKPEINIRLGARYLKYTHDQFAGDSMLAVAAYNGGPGNVNKWLKSMSKDDWDQFVENIPLSETRNYVRKVFRSYWAYNDIYARNNK
ncbi:MAG: transglycosylase SLT domain-containing protein [Cyanobacteriota bacterium]